MLQQVQQFAESCVACGRIIGISETPNLWREQIVCADCHERLAEQSIAMAFTAPRHRTTAEHSGFIAVAAAFIAIIGAGGILAWLVLTQ